MLPLHCIGPPEKMLLLKLELWRRGITLPWIKGAIRMCTHDPENGWECLSKNGKYLPVSHWDVAGEVADCFAVWPRDWVIHEARKEMAFLQ
ncbi:hypothetical protein AAFF_G00224070 [Aldrovandia affinis]|uniref:Uncharacterized protein n=1 Tax=Aldrovandia affinis TaxID=143900 RepID=A0AAD7TAV0_9TELE|nr:hypothetical protein AAFF_G00224070 [Aldrovandia affinis]